MKSKSGNNLHWDNATSRELQDAAYQLRRRSPSVQQRQRWYQEFLESGAQFRMSFQTFLKPRIKAWHLERWKKSRKKA